MVVLISAIYYLSVRIVLSYPVVQGRWNTWLFLIKVACQQTYFSLHEVSVVGVFGVDP